MKRILILTLAFLLAVGTTTAAFAEEQTVTATIRVNFAFLGKMVMGTLVMRNSGSPQSIDAAWTFTGTVDGNPASAKGQASNRWTGTAYEGTITKIETWDMAGLPQPALPLPISALQGTGQTIWSTAAFEAVGTMSFPLNIQGLANLPPPFQGDAALSVTNAAGIQEIKGLPRTGAAPEWMNLMALAFIVLGGTLLAAPIVSGRVLPRMR